MDWKQKVLAAAGLAVLALPAYAQTGAPSTSPNTQRTPPTGIGSPQTPGTQQTPGTPSTSAPTGSASPTTGAPDTMAGQGENREAMLLGFIHHANQQEIELGNLAKQNGSSSQVKDFADATIKDHKSADDQVLAFANSHKIDLSATHYQMKATKEAPASGSPSGVGGGSPSDQARAADQGMKSGAGHEQAMAAHKAEVDKLRTLKGPEFDREYTRVMVQDHQKVIDKLTTARSRISDTELTGLVDKLLPTYKQHLAMAQKLQDNLSKS